MSDATFIKHATFFGIATVAGFPLPVVCPADDPRYDALRHRACDWREINSVSVFAEFEATQMLLGEKVEPPDCPACSILLDLALELRGAS